MTHPYRTPPPAEPAPKKSLFCRMGLHRWEFLWIEAYDEAVYRCARPHCVEVCYEFG